MAFKTCGYPFIYKNIASELYDASIVFLSEDYTDRPSGSGVTVITDQVQRNAQLIQVGSQQEPALEFGIEIVFDEPVDIFVLTQVKDWLGGELKFTPLQICVDNFETFFYNCYITLEEDLIYNGGYRGIRCEVHCDAPWAWELEDDIEYDLIPDTDNIIFFNNLSADSDLLRPIIEFTMSANGSFSIENVTNQNRITQFTGLLNGEIVTVDNLTGVVKSSLGLLRFQNFNKEFLKMPKDINELIVRGKANHLKITFTNAKRLGGGFY